MTVINYNTFFKAHESIIIIKIRKERRKKIIFPPEECHMINAKYPSNNWLRQGSGMATKSLSKNCWEVR